MNPDPGPPVACRTCRRLLNRYVDLNTGDMTFKHPLSSDSDLPDHQPEPVPADQIDAYQVCDFCSDPRIVYSFRTRPIETVLVTARSQLVQSYGTDWAACIDCAQLIQARDTDGLFARCARNTGWPIDEQAAREIRRMQRIVLDSVQPGRTLVDMGQWQPVALHASTLPKVRDRLSQLLRGDDRLPLGLDPPDVRGQVAADLDAARLYWVDAEFTDPVRHGAASLPETALTPDDAPAPHGLLAWAEPVGNRAVIIAASWTSDADGIRFICYRSIGSGLEGASLQRLREQVGWLVPTFVTELRPGGVLDASSPVSAVVVTWLFIAQKLAETASVDVDRAIRRAYLRTGRPAPEVRLVRVRGTSRVGADSPPDERPRPGEGSENRDREYRWWVRGHWRNQPYGPGRARRRLIYIDPHVRGPEDKPIKANTTVRVLGTAARIPHPGDKS